MGVDLIKFGVGQYDSFYVFILMLQFVNDLIKGFVYNVLFKKENQNVFFFKINFIIDRYGLLI